MLKFTIDSLDGLDEALKPLYAEKGGKYHLQVEGAVSEEDVTGLRTALQTERANNQGFEKLRKDLGNPDTIRQRMSDLEQQVQDAAKGKGKDAEQIIAQMKQDYEGKLADLQSKLTGVHKDAVSKDLKLALGKAGVIPEALDGLAALASQRLEIGEDGVRVLSPDGKPMVGSNPDGSASLDELAKSIAESHTYAVADGGKGGGGTPGHKGGTPKQQTITRQVYDQMAPDEQRQAIADGATVVDKAS